MGTKILDQMFALEEELSKKKQWMKEMVEQGSSEVSNFYEGSVVFVTGGSGFLGKQLIEKLIRSCKVAKIYVLMRAKKNKTVEDRLLNILKEPVFEDLRKEQPTFESKIVPVDGDVADLRIGISDKHWRNLTEEVNFIFHAAATTNFDMPLKSAILINVRGTREVLSLAKACKQLRCMVYVSTAYSQTINSRLKAGVVEKFYECPVPADAVIEFAEVSDECILNGFMDLFRNEWPNSYTFTKGLAEEIVRNSGDLPICVVRPAVVIAADREPRLGWLDNNAVFSITGLFLGVCLGLLHVCNFDLNVTTDFVPVDYVNNATIVAAKETVIRYTNGEKEKRIYAITSNRNPPDKNLIDSVASNEGMDIPAANALYHFFTLTTANKFLFTIYTWILHYIPAMLIDIVLRITGNKLRLLRIYQKAYKMTFAFDHFEKKQWILDDYNTENLFENMSKIDKDIFFFNIASVDWRSYFIQCIYGIKKYLMREDFTNIAQAKKKQFWQRVLHYILLPLYLYSLFKAGVTFVRLLICFL